MKRFKNLVIGGIQSKIFNLILYTVVLLTVAFMAVALYQSNMLANVVGESGQRQKAAISEITGGVMDQVVVQSLGRSNKTEARFADDMFSAAAERVAFMADCVGKVFSNPASYAVQPFAGPDPADDGVWTAKVIYANGADEQDEAIRTKLGLLANLTDPLVSLCASFGVEDVYIALPEGAFFTVDDISSSWFVEGKPRDYDPRERQWYRQAVQSGDMIFTDGEWDVNTGKYCVECAMPVYGADGELQAVVGLDLFLDEIQQVMQDSSVDGEFNLLVNQDGRAVLPMQAEIFPLAEADRENDLRASSNLFLAQIVSSALEGKGASVTQGELSDGAYYVTATPIGTTGWVLLSAFDQSISDQPAQLLEQSLAQVQTEATAVYQEKSAKSRTTAIVLLLIVMLLTLVGALVLGKRIVKPLNTITKRISELSEGNLEFKMEDAYKTGDEVEELAQSFAAISHKTVVYMDKVVKVTAEKERIGAELSLATQIQASMLPHIFPAFPERGEFDIYASMDPAKEVGGDFYDYFLTDDDHLCMVIADVSGKGVPAALFMMASKIILQSVAMMGLTPAGILQRTNEAICSNNEAQMFVTVWLGILELSTGRLTAANAGHEFPALRQPNGKFELYKDKHGFVIGGMEGVRYREYELQLEPGSKLFVYTDGVAEATSAEKELYGTERMIDALNEDPDAAPQQILKNVRASVDGFVKDAEQFDDLTMLCVEYKGGEKA
mgnify:CR=1 FL=1